MGRLQQALSAYSLVGVDTSIFIYHLEGNPRYRGLAKEVLAGVEEGRWAAVTSTIMLLEVTVRPWQMDQSEIARQYEILLVHFPHLKLRDVDRDVARKASQLRARLGLRPADAIQAATCLVEKAKALVTNDRQMARLKPVLDVFILEDYLLPPV